MYRLETCAILKTARELWQSRKEAQNRKEKKHGPGGDERGRGFYLDAGRGGFYMQTGEVIRKYRKQRNLTQEEMAQRLGVTAPAVNKWENGDSLR